MKTILKWLLRVISLIFVLFSIQLLWSGIRQGNEVAATLLATAFPLAFAGGLWHWSNSNVRKAANIKKLAEETEEFFNYVNEYRFFPELKPTRVISAPGREILAACDAKLFELTTTRTSKSLGTRLKIGNAPIYIGSSVPSSTNELKESSAGELAITSSMLIFSGANKSVDMALTRITSVEILLDGITLTVTGRQRPITFQLSNPLLWGMLLRNLLQIKVTGRKLPDGAALGPL